MDKDNDRIYPCDDCGMLRSKNEGGTVFTVCEKCWGKRYPEKSTKDKLVEKIARATRAKQMNIVGYSKVKPEDGTTEGLDLELAKVALEAILSDPTIVEIDPDAELPDSYMDVTGNIIYNEDLIEGWRMCKSYARKASWVKKK